MTIGLARPWSWVFFISLCGVLACDSGGDVETAAVLALIEQGDSADSFERSVPSVEAGASVTVTLPPNGGFAATLSPK